MPKGSQSIKSIKGDLAAARKKARRNAGGQLDAIAGNTGDQINRQLRKLDKRTHKIVSGMERFADNQQEIGQARIAGVKRQGQTIAGQRSATGARNTVGDSMIVGARMSQAKRQATATTGMADVLATQGKGVGKAQEQALSSLKGVNKKASGSAATVLDVLNSERAMLDTRFVTEIKEERRAQRLDRKFQLKLLSVQQKMAEEMALFENNLPLGAADRESMDIQQQMSLEQMRMQHKYNVKMANVDAQLMAASSGGADGAFAGFSTSLHTGQEVASAAANMFKSEEFSQQIANFRASSTDADGNPGEAGSMTDTDIARQIISERVTGLAGDTLSPEAVDRIVYDVVRNDGEVSPKFVVNTVAAAEPEWAAIAEQNPKRLMRFAMAGQAASAVAPVDLSQFNPAANPWTSGGDTLTDPSSESASGRSARLLTGEVYDDAENEERNRLVTKMGYLFRGTP